MASTSLLYETILAQFQGLLHSITMSKDSIQKATKQVMDNPTFSESLISAIGLKISVNYISHSLFICLSLLSVHKNKIGSTK